MKWLTIENEFGILQKMNIKRRKMMYTESKNGTKKLTTYQLTLTAVMAAVICVLGPISIAIPVSPVPISLGSMAVYLAVTVLGMKLGTLSCLIYLLLGLVGLPVFAGGSAGAAKLFGPTGGYLIGYLFLALIAGAFVGRFAENKWKNIAFAALGMILGTIVLYALGTAWLAYSAGMDFQAALWAGVIPFIPGDLVKMVIAVLLGSAVRGRLLRAGVLKGKNYSIYAAYFRIKAKGIKALSEMAASVWDGNLTIIRIQLILLIVFQIVIVLHIVTQWLHKEYYLNIAALVVLGVYIVVNESGFEMLADNSTKTILIPAIIMIFVMAEVLIRKMLDVWKDAKESAEIFAEKEREEKEEERRRLYFPGNYTKLFYQMVWHNFKYDWKDYGLLLFCGVIVSAFSFAGLGIYQMMKWY